MKKSAVIDFEIKHFLKLIINLSVIQTILENPVNERKRGYIIIKAEFLAVKVGY